MNYTWKMFPPLPCSYMSLTQKCNILYSNSTNWKEDSRPLLLAECKNWEFCLPQKCLFNLGLDPGQLTLKQIRCIFTESCVGRCGHFNPRNKCQCDSLCVYYGSCCTDFDTVCPKKSQYRSRYGLYLYISHYKQLFFLQHNRLPQLPVATPSASWKKFPKRGRLHRARQLLHRLSAH